MTESALGALSLNDDTNKPEGQPATSKAASAKAASALACEHAERLGLPRISSANAAAYPPPSLNEFRTEAARKAADAPPAIWYWQMTGLEWARDSRTYELEKKRYRRLVEDKATEREREQQRAPRERARDEDKEREREQQRAPRERAPRERAPRDRSGRARPADDNERRTGERSEQACQADANDERRRRLLGELLEDTGLDSLEKGYDTLIEREKALRASAKPLSAPLSLSSTPAAHKLMAGCHRLLGKFVALEMHEHRLTHQGRTFASPNKKLDYADDGDFVEGLALCCCAYTLFYLNMERQVAWLDGGYDDDGCLYDGEQLPPTSIVDDAYRPYEYHAALGAIYWRYQLSFDEVAELQDACDAWQTDEDPVSHASITQRRLCRAEHARGDWCRPAQRTPGGKYYDPGGLKWSERRPSSSERRGPSGPPPWGQPWEVGAPMEGGILV